MLGTNHLLKNREMHVLYDDTVKAINDTVNDTVFNLITQNSKITTAEISGQLKISLSTTKRKTKELKEKGYIERIGSDKTGNWKIIKKL